MRMITRAILKFKLYTKLLNIFFLNNKYLKSYNSIGAEGIKFFSEAFNELSEIIYLNLDFRYFLHL